MNLDTGAGLLHRLTSYVPAREWDVPVDDPRVRHDLVPNDPATRPPPMKTYPDGLAVRALPRDLPDPGVPATAVLAGAVSPAQPDAAHPLDAAQLGRVLFLGAGVVRTMQRNGHRLPFRASGSAGGRFRPAGGFRWRSTPVPVASLASRMGCTGTTGSGTPWSRSRRPPPVR